jgi:hypothetical protein
MVVPDHRRNHVPRIRRVVVSCALAAALVLAVAIAGCGDSGPTFVDNGTNYSKTTALQLLANTDASSLAQQPTADAGSLRHAALNSLRRHGLAASAAADLLTKTLPTDANGVPVYVEVGFYDSSPAVILVEAIGPASGTLSTKRLWAIGTAGAVLFVGTR